MFNKWLPFADRSYTNTHNIRVLFQLGLKIVHRLKGASAGYVINYTIRIKSNINVNVKVKCHNDRRVDPLGQVPHVGQVHVIAHAQYYNVWLRIKSRK